MIKETIKISDKHGFVHEITVEHSPHLGYSVAINSRDIIIADVEYGRMVEPTTDNDAEWESYEERLQEWKERAVSDLIPKCKEYFDNQ